MENCRTADDHPARSSRTIWAVAGVAGATYLAILPFEFGTALKNLCLVLVFLCALQLSPVALIRRSTMWPAFALWLVAALASVTWSLQPALSLESIWREIVKSIIVFYCFYVLAQRGLSTRTLTIGMLVGGAAFASLALYDFVVFNEWHNPHSPPRYDVSVTALTWSAFLFLPAWTQAAAAGKALKWSARTTLLGLLAAGFMSGSRSFALAVILGLLLLALLYVDWQDKRRRPLTAAGLGLAMLFPLLLYSALNSSRPIGFFADRTVLYGKTLEKILHNPWLGTGFGHETDRVWYAETFSKIPGWEGLAAATHPHNIVLSYMDQMGIGGLLVLIVLFASLARPLLCAIRSSSPAAKAIGSAGLLLLLGTLVSNSFNFYFTRHHLWLFIATMGLFHGWLKEIQTSANATRPSGPLPD